jgi:putative ABC transport system permease protein
MSDALRDVRLALRAQWRQPALAAVVVLTLALALAANATILAIVDALFIRPFPLPDVDRLVQVFGSEPRRDDFSDRASVAPADFLDYARESRVAERLIALEWWDANLTGTAEPERLQAFRVTPGFFRVLGIEPVVGRSLLAHEGEPGRNHVVVVGHGLWERRYARDPALVGRVIQLDGEPYTVVGIAPERFDYPVSAEIWAPLAFDAKTAPRRDTHYLEVIGRVRDGYTAGELQAELATIARRLEREFPDTNRGWSVNVLPLPVAVRDVGVGPFLLVWQTSALLILLIACANVANLLLARGASREKELALRAALGAGRARIVRLLLTESVVMALCGAALAVPLAWTALRVVKAAMPPQIARFVRGWDQIDVDGRLLVALAALALGAAIVFGCLPAFRASRMTLSDALKEGGRGSGGGGRHRLGSALVVAEVALALTLLVAAGLSVRGTLRVLWSDDGYDPEGVLTMRLTLPQARYGDDERKRQFFERLVERARALPGVERAAVTNVVPSGGHNTSRTLEVDGRPAARPGEEPYGDYRAVTPDYFPTMRMRMLAGRMIDGRDRDGTLPVAVVSRGMADRFWSGADAIGRRFRIVREGQPWLTVVGIAADVRHQWFNNRIEPTFYVPFAQAPAEDMVLVLRSAGDPAALAPGARESVWALDPDQPVYDVRTMRRIRRDRAIGLSYAAAFMGGFGIVGLLLAAVGVYGVMAYAVSLRTQEIGVRVALGASRADVLAATIGRSMRLTALGLALGLVGAFALGKLMESALFGTVELDVASFVVFPLVLALSALAAGFFPARRAMRVDPVVALRAQ